MLTHYHKAEGIQIIGPLKPSNVNWVKLQWARVAVAEDDAYIITVRCLPRRQKKALMNLPWLPVFSTTILIAHIQSMWQVAVNPSTCFALQDMSGFVCLSGLELHFQPSVDVRLGLYLPLQQPPLAAWWRSSRLLGSQGGCWEWKSCLFHQYTLN